MSGGLRTLTWQVGVGFWLALVGTVGAEEAAKPAFYLPFDKTVKASNGQEPTQVRGIKYVPGVLGDAVYIGGHGNHNYLKSPLLEYDTKELFAGESGTVMFWVRSDWDGQYKKINKMPWYTLFSTMGGQKAKASEKNSGVVVDFTSQKIPPKNDFKRMSIFMYAWLRADMKRADPAGVVSLTKRVRGAWLKGDWWHIAVTWNASGWCRLYVNGLPYAHGGSYSKGSRPQKVSVSLKDTQRMYIGGRPRTWTASHRANSAIDEFQIFSQAISDEQVWRAYHQVMPLDIVLDQRFVLAGQKDSLTLEIAPAGQLELPTSDWKVEVPAQVELDVRLIRDADQEVVAHQAYTLKVDRLTEVSLPIPPVSQGKYRLTYVVKQGPYQYQKSYVVQVYQPASPLVGEERGVTLGDVVVLIDATDPKQEFVSSGKSKIVKSNIGTYRQAGENKMDRIGYRLNIPDDLIGKTTMIRITWPDDRPRSIGWYAYRDKLGNKTRQHRDRLGGGTQSGDEYPLTHTMRTTEYLFYPQTKQYLFTARTKIPGYPAALAKVELLPVIGRLPKLKINRPKGLPQRHFGHMDEDQSFEIPMPAPKNQGGDPCIAVGILDRLFDYFDYTGQDTMSYPLIRYNYTLNTVRGTYTGGGLRAVGWQKLMLDMMHQRGKRLIATINSRTTTRAKHFPQQVEHLQKMGYFQIDRFGKIGDAYRKSYRVNPAHPQAKADLLQDIGLILKRYGSHRALAGLDLWHLSGRGAWAFGNLNRGYGDWTIRQFEKETGIHLGIDQNDPLRFPKRYDLLTGKHLEAWLQWRADQNTQMVRQIAQLARDTRKDLKVHVTVLNQASGKMGGVDSYLDYDFAKALLESSSIDVQALKAIPGVQLTLMRKPTSDRWVKARLSGYHTALNELLWDEKQPRALSGKQGVSVWNYYAYFESFNDSLLPKEFSSYFQNADVKPHGRFYLQDYSVPLASVDAQTILGGAQPVGTAGRDVYAREFSKAFLALPAIPFTELDKSGDPVIARYAQTANGTYVYFTNLSWSPVTAVLKWPGNNISVQDLSSNQKLSMPKARLVMKLKPYETRSILVNQKVTPALLNVQIPPKTLKWFGQQYNALNGMIGLLVKHGADASEQQTRVALIREAIAQRTLGRAHMLIFSKLMRDMPALKTVAAKGYLKKQKEMLAASQYAVNCGSNNFFGTKDGGLFFPDQGYREGSYGYVGSYKRVGRPLGRMKNVKNRVVFASEAYDIEQYSFAVKPGRYTVRIYLKIGYMRNAKPNHFVSTIRAEDVLILDKRDVWDLMDKHSWKGYVHEVRDIEVTDGVLDLRFSGSPDRSSTTRMCNAIEVIPQP